MTHQYCNKNPECCPNRMVPTEWLMIISIPRFVPLYLLWGAWNWIRIAESSSTTQLKPVEMLLGSHDDFFLKLRPHLRIEKYHRLLVWPTYIIMN